MGSCKRCKGDSSCSNSFIIVKDGKAVKKPKTQNIVVVNTEKPKSKNKHVTFAKSPKESTKGTFILTIRAGFDLQLPKDFFGSCNKKTTTFNIKYLYDESDQKIVLKWVRGSHDCNFGNHVGYLVSAAEKTAEVLSAFAEHVDMRGWKIRVVKPLVPKGPKEIGIEPYIKNIEVFNTNSFWETDYCRTDRKLVLALVHFSYAYSDGEWVLTNLEGGADEDGQVVTLLPPTIVSGTVGKFGCRDLGNVHQFYGRHSCNSICRCMGDPVGSSESQKVSDGGRKKTDIVFEIVEE